MLTADSSAGCVTAADTGADDATISGDIIEADTHSWAIHGSIAVDGEVIVTETDTPDKARLVLGKLSSADHGTAAP
jgi:hypothetical protein